MFPPCTAPLARVPQADATRAHHACAKASACGKIVRGVYVGVTAQSVPPREVYILY